MPPQTILALIAPEEHSPTVSPGTTQKFPGLLVVMVKWNQIRGYVFQSWGHGQSEQAAQRRIKAFEKQAKNSAIPCRIDDHPHVSLRALRPETLLQLGDRIHLNDSSPAA